MLPSGFAELPYAEKEGFEPSIPENGSGTGVHASSRMGVT